MSALRWVLGLVATVVYYCRGTVCVHPGLEQESATIEETRLDGRGWTMVVRCVTCHERWTLKVRTRL